MFLRSFDRDQLRGPFALVQTSAPTAEPISLTAAKLHLRVDFDDDDAMIQAYITAARQMIEEFCGLCLVSQSWAYSFQQLSEWEIGLPRANPLITVDSVIYFDENDTQQTLDPSVYQVSTTTTPGRVRPNWNQVWPSLWYRMDAVTFSFTAGHLLPADFDDATDTVACAGHPYADDDIVRVYNTDGDWPGGLVDAKPYYVIGASAGVSLQLSLTKGGSAIDLTSTGTGQSFLYQKAPPIPVLAAIKLMLGHLYENRQEVVVETGKSTVERVPMGIQALIAPYRLFGF